jgi:deoxyribose-phosphate aldolase
MDIIDPKVLDFANHRADATEEEIKILCEAVLQYGFNSAFLNPTHVALARKLLGNKAKVGTVISFPLGQDVRDVKIHAIREAIQAGADELDIIPDISRVSEEKYDLFKEELTALVIAAKSMRGDVIVKFIIETGLFVPEQFLSLDTPEIQKGKEKIQEASLAIEKSGADFVKLCSGLGHRGVSVNDVAFVRSVVSPTMKIKGAGGIDTKKEALDLISAGANRLGTSHAPEIIDEN